MYRTFLPMQGLTEPALQMNMSNVVKTAADFVDSLKEREK